MKRILSLSLAIILLLSSVTGSLYAAPIVLWNTTSESDPVEMPMPDDDGTTGDYEIGLDDEGNNGAVLGEDDDFFPSQTSLAALEKIKEQNEFLYNYASRDIPQAGDPSLSPEKDIESDDPAILAKAMEITQDLQTDAEKLRAIHDWVASSYEYDHYSITGNYGYTSASKLLNVVYGKCQGFSNLTAALCRSIGIPCRVVWGFEYSANWTDYCLVSNKIATFYETQPTNHAWNEAYVDGRWVMLDATLDNPTSHGNYTATKAYDIWYDMDPNHFDKYDFMIIDYKTPVRLGNSILTVCKKNITLEAYTSSATEIHDLPEGITVLEEKIFRWNTDLQSITLPESVVFISSYAFDGCRSLKSVSLPAGVKTIGYGAFRNCLSLEEIHLPESLLILDRYAFYGCSRLRKLQLPKSIKNIEEASFQGCKSLEEILFPETLESIGSCAFMDCSMLCKLQLPDGLREIKDSAFENCTGLKSLSTGPSLESLDSNAFRGCASLETVDLSASPLTNLSGSFSHCENLRSINISCPTLTTLNGSLASVCSSLTEVILPPYLEHMGAYCFSYCSKLESILLPQTLQTIGTGAFYESGLREITLPPGVTTIADECFYNCSNLKRVAAGDITAIGKYAFYGCTALQEAPLSEGLTSLSDYCFSLCKSLKTLTLPVSVQSVGRSAFESCSALESLTVLNPLCDFGPRCLASCNVNLLTLYGPEYSSAQTHAETNGFRFLPLEPDTEELDGIRFYHTISLESDIALSVVVEQTVLSEYDSFFLRCSIPEYEGNTLVGTTTVFLPAVPSGSFFYFVVDGMTAVSMTDRIQSCLCLYKDGKLRYTNTDDYAIADYAYGQLEKASSSTALKTLCAELLRYGAKAQLFKGYRTDSLADAHLTEAAVALLADPDTVSFPSINQVLEDNDTATIQWLGKSLSLDSTVGVNVIFSSTSTTTISTYKLEVTYVDGKGQQVTELISNPTLYNSEQKYYSFTFSGLMAAELRTTLTMRILNYQGKPISKTLVYNPATYGNNKSGDLLILCKALFAYSDAAKAYFGG